jgi:hypothetical protein
VYVAFQVEIAESSRGMNYKLDNMTSIMFFIPIPFSSWVMLWQNVVHLMYTSCIYK